MKRARILFVLGLLVCAAPLICVLLASAIAHSRGCELNEGFANPCVIAGVDWADTLYTMFVSGWLLMLTAPIAVLLALAWIVAEIITFVRRRRGRTEA